MKIQSKINSYFIILILVLATANCFFIFLLWKLLDKSVKIDFKIFVIPVVFISILFPLLIMIIRSLKTIYISDDKIILKHIFRKDYELKNSEILNFYQKIDRDKFGEYKTFYFKTNLDTFKIASREFKNYDEIVQNIIPKTKYAEINIHFELKMFFLIFLITVGTLILIVCLQNT